MTTATLDYGPVLDGRPYDPADNGGGVDSLRLYLNGDLNSTPVVTAGPAVKIDEGRYRFTFEEPAEGNYAAVFTWRETANSDPYVDADGVMSFPLDPGPEPIPAGLVVGIDAVARAAGFPFPLSASTREAVFDAIDAAQSDVEAHLGRPITPIEMVETGLYSLPSGWATKEPALKIVKVENETYADGTFAGTFTVTYLTGLDVVNNDVYRPIRRYVKAHAAALLRQSPAALTAGLRRAIKSVSVEGQSISYSDTIGTQDSSGGHWSVGEGMVGSLPLLASLDRWRVRGRRVFQRRGVESDPGGFDRYGNADGSGRRWAAF